MFIYFLCNEKRKKNQKQTQKSKPPKKIKIGMFIFCLCNEKRKKKTKNKPKKKEKRNKGRVGALLLHQLLSQFVCFFSFRERERECELLLSV